MQVVKRSMPILRKGVVSKGNGLDIKHSTGRADLFHTSWMVIGPPGIGKSTLFSGFEDVLFLVTSEKEVGKLTVPYILITSWEQVCEVTDELVNNRSKYPYKFLVIDFIDAVWTLCDIAVCEKLKVDHRTDAQWGKGSDTLKTYFTKWITTLIASDYGIMMVSHIYEKDIFQSGGQLTKKICTLPPKARDAIIPLINVVGCIEYKTVTRTDAQTQRKMIEKKRIISFEGSEYVESKDRDGMLPSEIVLYRDPKQNYQIFKKYYSGELVKNK